MGPYSPQATLPSSTSATVCQTLSLPNTDDFLQRFWETEDIAAAPSHSPDDKVVLDNYKHNHVLLPEDRFRVSYYETE